jgi:hypothetical protein
MAVAFQNAPGIVPDVGFVVGNEDGGQGGVDLFLVQLFVSGRVLGFEIRQEFFSMGFPGGFVLSRLPLLAVVGKELVDRLALFVRNFTPGFRHHAFDISLPNVGFHLPDIMAGKHVGIEAFSLSKLACFSGPLPSTSKNWLFNGRADEWHLVHFRSKTFL